MITYNAEWSDTLRNSTYTAIRLAKENNDTVNLIFNNIELKVTEDARVSDIQEEYLTKYKEVYE